MKIDKNVGILMLIVVIGAFLRLYHLGANSLWLDEIWSVVAASGSWHDMIKTLSADSNHVPLFHVVMYWVVHLSGSTSEWLVRLPSCLFGIAALPIFYKITKDTIDEPTALMGTLLLAVSPMAILYSQDARMYSMFLLLALLSLQSFLLYQKTPTKKMAWVLGLINGVLLLTHFFSLIIVGIEALLIVWEWIKKRVTNRMVSDLIVFVAMFGIYCLWLPVIIGNLSVMQSYDLWHGLKPNFYFFKIIFSNFSSNSEYRDVWFYLFGILYGVGIFALWKNKNKNGLLLNGLFVAIIAGLFLLSFIKIFLKPRHLIFLLPVYLMSVAVGIRYLFGLVKIDKRWGLAAIVAMMAIPVYSYYGRLQDYQPDWRSAAQFLHEHVGTGDEIAITDKHSRGCLAYYYEKDLDAEKKQALWQAFGNDAAGEIGIVTQQVYELVAQNTWHGWIVLSPNNFGNVSLEPELRQILKNPIKEYKTNEKSKTLAIYKL